MLHIEKILISLLLVNCINALIQPMKKTEKRCKLQEWKFQLDKQEWKLTSRQVKHWNKLARKAVKQTFKTEVDLTWSELIWVWNWIQTLRRKLEQMTFRGAFQLKLFYDFMKVYFSFSYFRYTKQKSIYIMLLTKGKSNSVFLGRNRK